MLHFVLESAPYINYLYVNLSIPLGDNGQVRTYARSRDDRSGSVFGAGFSGKINEFAGYQVDVEKNSLNDATYSSISADWVQKYTTLNMALGQSSSGLLSHSLLASGGAILHDQGVAFSPVEIGDTFGVVKVGNVSGVPVETPGGVTWTAANGLAPVPTLPAFYNAQVDVRDALLPDDVEVASAQQSVKVARGAVVSVEVEARRVRRVWLQVTRAGQQVLPRGSGVLIGADNFITQSGANGVVMFADFQPDQTYTVEFPGGGSCTLSSIVIKPKQVDDAFERGTAQCL